MAADLMAVLQQHLEGAPLDETLSRLAQDDPELAPLAQLLAQREHELEADLGHDEPEDVDESVRVAAREATRETEQLREHVDALATELDQLRVSVESVGFALGACPTCLGAVEGCPLCHGRGQPGALPPDPTAFDQLVLPAVRARAYEHARARTRKSHAAQSPDERSTP